MRSIMLSVCIAVLMLCLSPGLSALAEIRTSDLDSAWPRTGVGFFYGSAFKSSWSRDIPGMTQTKYASSLVGGRFSLKVNPRIEASFWVSSKDDNTAVELQGKYLFYQNANTYISVAPCVYNSGGDYSRGSSEAECSLNGFGLPLILTLDTRRNLSLNVMAGFNLDYVKARGKYVYWDSTNHEYVTDIFDYDPVLTTRAHINFSVDANAWGMFMIPELGITFADSHDQGMVRFLNFGIKIGFRK